MKSITTKITPICRYILVSTILILTNHGFGQVTVINNAPGPNSWTVPCGVTSIIVRIYGAGGGGAGSSSGGQAGGGGGSGGYTTSTFAVVPGQTFPFVVGSGGTLGGPTTNGSNGGSSSWDGGVLIASGGSGGNCSGNGGTGGLGGTGVGGTTNLNGNVGATGGASAGGFGGSQPGPNGGFGGSGGQEGLNGSIGGAYGAGGGGGGDKNGGVPTSGGAGGPGAVVILYTSSVTQPNAGVNQSACGSLNLAGNGPDAGWIGTWSVISGAALIADANDSISGISGIAPGTCATLRWTFTQAGCITMTDDVIICSPLACNDDPCNATPLTVSTTGCVFTQYSNSGATVSTGMVEPGCGGFDANLDNDVWFSVVVPANGQVNIEAVDNGALGDVYPGIAIYEGVCDTLTHAGCIWESNLGNPSDISYNGTPGSTIYIRIWDALNSTNGFGLCVHSNANATGNVFPGSTSVTCGTPMTFMDPGGTGNYANNSSGYYVLCPETVGEYVTIDFSSFSIENGYDALTILDGSGNLAQLIGQYTGNENPGVITSGDSLGCLTVIFQSDNIISGIGWNAIVSCSPTQGNNTYVCSSTNCTGGCGQWVCESGLFPTTNDGNGVQDLNIESDGCFGSAGEIATKWFYFRALTAGTIEFSFDGPNGQDYNFAVWGPSIDFDPPCPLNNGEAPIRCSQALVTNTGNPVGLNALLGAGEEFEGPEGNGWVDAIDVLPGQTYAMILNIYQSGNPQPVIDLTVGGSGLLDCTASSILLSVSLESIYGINQGDRNLVTWITNTERSNDYFQIEHSENGIDWEIIGNVDGAGNSNSPMYYSIYDDIPYLPISYYRLKQVDFNGAFQYSQIVAVNSERIIEDIVSKGFPNPVNDVVTFIYNGKNQNVPLNIQVIDGFGKIMDEYSYVSLNEGDPITYPTTRLSAGMYQVKFSQGDQQYIQKLSVIR